MVILIIIAANIILIILYRNKIKELILALFICNLIIFLGLRGTVTNYSSKTQKIDKR